MNNKNYWLSWLGGIIAISPALGYGLAYCFEKGYCDFFKIPQELIKIEWSAILLSILAAFGGLFLALWLVAALVTPNLQKMSINKLKFYFAFVYGLGFLMVAISFLTVKEAKVAGIMYLFLLIFIFVAPSIIRRYKKENKKISLLERKMIEHKETVNLLIRNQTVIIEPKEIERKDFIAIILNNQIVKYILIFVVIIVIGYTSAYYTNRAKAMNQQVFYIPSSNPQLVVLRIYGENLICAPIDHQETGNYGQIYNIINEKFIILKMDEPGLFIIPSKIGYVRVIELP